MQGTTTLSIICVFILLCKLTTNSISQKLFYLAGSMELQMNNKHKQFLQQRDFILQIT